SGAEGLGGRDEGGGGRVLGCRQRAPEERLVLRHRQPFGRQSLGHGTVAPPVRDPGGVRQHAVPCGRAPGAGPRRITGHPAHYASGDRPRVATAELLRAAVRIRSATASGCEIITTCEASVPPHSTVIMRPAVAAPAAAAWAGAPGAWARPTRVAGRE